MASPVDYQGAQAEIKLPVKCENTQLQSTVDFILTEISTCSGHMVTLEKVKILVEALAKNQCFDNGFPDGGTRLNYLENVKKKMTMNKESRTTLITWLINNANKYCSKFEQKEKIEGIKILLGQIKSKSDNSEAEEWFKEMCLKPLFDVGIPGIKTLSESILIACKHEHVAISQVLEDGIEKRLKAGMNQKLKSEIYDDCIPETLKTDEREFEKMNTHQYLELPLCVLHASENLKVNIRILCFPSREEVIFYNQKPKTPGNVTILIGLIGHETYVPLIKITKDDRERELSLIETIAQLKQKIEVLQNTTAKTEEERKKLEEQIKIYKEELIKKEKEYSLKILEMTEKTKDTIKKATAEVADQIAERVARGLIEEFMNL